jgi:hypothetical protein
MISVNIDVDIEDILYDMTDQEIQKMIDGLYEDGYTPTQLSVGVPEEQKNIIDLEWDMLVHKMSKSRLQISSEDEQTIRNILSKYGV